MKHFALSQLIYCLHGLHTVLRYTNKCISTSSFSPWLFL